MAKKDMENEGIVYVVDLLKKDPELEYMDLKCFQEDLKNFEASSIEEINQQQYDYKYFNSEELAEKFIEEYTKVLKTLSNDRICNSRDLPAMLYKRRYIVQTLLGLKMQTYRHYKKPWKKGQLINLHDQVNFLTVRILSVTQLAPENYCYKFELP